MSSKPTPSQKVATEVDARTTDESQIEASKQEISSQPAEEKKNKKKAPARKRGKNYVAASKKLKEFRSMAMPVTEALRQVKSASYVKFDESYELHVNTIEVGLKGEVELPFTNGKSIRVAVADDSVLSELEKGVIAFDVLLATPAFMPKLTKYAKLLGPRGLMPNPKAGTVVTDTEAAKKKFSGNTLRYKTEPKTPVIHLVVGKKSFSDDQVVANITAILAGLDKAKVKTIYLCTSMSPSVQVMM